MVKVKMGAIIKEVQDPYWYIQARWQVLEEKKEVIKKEEVEVKNETNTKKNVKRHR